MPVLATTFFPMRQDHANDNMALVGARNKNSSIVRRSGQGTRVS